MIKSTGTKELIQQLETEPSCGHLQLRIFSNRNNFSVPRLVLMSLIICIVRQDTTNINALPPIVFVVFYRSTFNAVLSVYVYIILATNLEKLRREFDGKFLLDPLVSKPPVIGRHNCEFSDQRARSRKTEN